MFFKCVYYYFAYFIDPYYNSFPCLYAIASTFIVRVRSRLLLYQHQDVSDEIGYGRKIFRIDINVTCLFVYHLILYRLRRYTALMRTNLVSDKKFYYSFTGLLRPLNIKK
jgi:hypothetical protein